MINSIPIELDKLRHIRFTANAIADLEAVMKQPFSLLAMESAGVRTARAMLWAGIKWEEKSLTLEKVGDLIDEWIAKGKTIDELYLLLIDAFVEGKWLVRNLKLEEGGEKNGESTK